MLIAMIMLVLAGCAAIPTQIDASDRTAHHGVCPEGAFPVYTVNEFETQFNGCAGTGDLRLLVPAMFR